MQNALFLTLPTKPYEAPTSPPVAPSSLLLPPQRSLSPVDLSSPASSRAASGSDSTFSSPKRSCRTTPLFLPPIEPSPPIAASLRRVPYAERDGDYVQSNDADDDDDDEYVPIANSRKRRRRTVSKPSKPATSGQSSRPIKALPSAGPRTKRARVASSSRLPQATGAVAALIRRAIKSPNAEGLDFECPACPKSSDKYPSTRMPDFKRHLRAHLRPEQTDESTGWWCKGILYSDFMKFPLEDQARMKAACPRDAGEPYEFNGEIRICGCRTSFSRRDALKRHLGNNKMGCLGTSPEMRSEHY